jgi:lia operon protein LiaG
MSHLSAAPAVVALAFAVTAVAHAQLPTPQRLVLRGPVVATWNLAGSTSITAGSGNSTEVIVTLHGRDADRLRVERKDVDGHETVTVVYPDETIVYPAMGRSNSTFNYQQNGRWGQGGGWGSRRARVRGSGSGVEAWADLEIRVPRDVMMEAHQAVGMVRGRDLAVDDLLIETMAATTELERVTGDVRIDAGSGDVTGRTLSGKVTVDIGSGTTELRTVRSDRVTIDAGSGRVMLDDVAGGELAIDIGSGQTELSAIDVRSLHVDSGSGSVRAALRNRISDVLIDTGSGGVDLLLPSTFDARVDIESGSGGIDTEFPVTVTRVERDALRGVIGEGRGSLRVDTGSGRVQLRKAM